MTYSFLIMSFNNLTFAAFLLQVTVVYSSTFMLVSLSIDRVDAIARPMNFTRKGRYNLGGSCDRMVKTASILRSYANGINH